MSWNIGFPGGCPTSSLYDDAINSPQSQKDAVGSIVERYVNAAITKTTAEVIPSQSLNFLLSINKFKISSFAETMYFSELAKIKQISYLCKKEIAHYGR